MDSLALILPAAGTGERIREPVPKPYLELNGRPILEHTLSCFAGIPGLTQVVIATSGDYLEQAAAIAGRAVPSVESASVEGGGTRQESIYNALGMISGTELVAVHDGVRPFVDAEVIARCCDKAAETGAAVVGVPVSDTIKKTDGEGVIRETPDRRYLWQAQTPQVFRREILLKAYHRAAEEGFSGTDDASLVERLGVEVWMVEGNQTNFKITYPADLKLARILTEE